MADHADVIREALERIHCVDDHGYVYAGPDPAAIAALGELVAERDRLRREVNSARAYRETLEGLPEGTLPRA